MGLLDWILVAAGVWALFDIAAILMNISELLERAYPEEED
jgi:hypothetical protein